MELQQIWQEIKKRVCITCIDGDRYGNCRIDPAIDCTVELYLSEIVHAVTRGLSDHGRDFVQELRARLCGKCKYQTGGGECRLRPTLECALDRYFPLIVQTVGEANR